MTNYELSQFTRAAIEWNHRLGVGDPMAAKLSKEIDAMNIDVKAAGAALDDLRLAAIGAAAHQLSSIFGRADDSERLLAFALADYIEQNKELINSRLKQAP
jgi:hypothetical protein